MGTASRLAVSSSVPGVYRRRRPEKTDYYRLVSGHLESYLAQREAEEAWTPSHVEDTFRAYLSCGILPKGFARVRCTGCGYELLVAFSCRRRGACPSCGTKYMVETAAHLVDSVLPRVPYRQWVLSMPKRLRYYARHDPRHGGALLRIFLRAVESAIRCLTPDVPADLAGPARVAAVSFFHRAGASLNEHLHFHSLISDGLFALNVEGNQDPTLTFHPAQSIEDQDLHRLTETLRRRMLRYCTRQGLLDELEAGDMETWAGHGGFSLYASPPIAADDRYALERVARYCARPPFAERRLHLLAQDRVLYKVPARKGHAQETLLLPPLLFLDRIAKVIPPPRVHRHTYYGAIAPHSQLRPYVIQSAAPDEQTAQRLQDAARQMDLLAQTHFRQLDLPAENAEEQASPPKEKSPPQRKPSRFWAMMIARIYEIFPLLCPRCQQPLKFIAFLTNPDIVRPLLTSMGENPDPPPLAPARDPPQAQPNLDFAENRDEIPPPPAFADFNFDQRNPHDDEDIENQTETTPT